jgi:uncharacterized protein with PIN domain
MCKRCFEAIDGRLWIPAAVCAGGRWTAITEKMSLSDLASPWGDRARLPSNTLTLRCESLTNVKPFPVRLNFHGNLDFFLQSAARGRSIERTLSEKTSVKDVIEACGVPHPEIDLVLVDGQPVDFHYGIVGAANVELYPPRTAPPDFKYKQLQVAKHTSFVADGHLGKLARDLRLLGFDVAYEPTAEDRQLLELMDRENRALLTRDRRLLMHAVVKTGYCPRSQNADEQTIEVIRRFDLLGSIVPFTRCLRCNAALRKVSKAEVIEKLEPLTKIYYEEFRRCTGCGQVYWAGSHFSKLQKRLDQIRERCS